MWKGAQSSHNRRRRGCHQVMRNNFNAPKQGSNARGNTGDVSASQIFNNTRRRIHGAEPNIIHSSHQYPSSTGATHDSSRHFSESYYNLCYDGSTSISGANHENPPIAPSPSFLSSHDHSFAALRNNRPQPRRPFSHGRRSNSGDFRGVISVRPEHNVFTSSIEEPKHGLRCDERTFHAKKRRKVNPNVFEFEEQGMNCEGIVSGSVAQETSALAMQHANYKHNHWSKNPSSQRRRVKYVDKMDHRNMKIRNRRPWRTFTGEKHHSNTSMRVHSSSKRDISGQGNMDSLIVADRERRYDRRRSCYTTDSSSVRHNQSRPFKNFSAFCDVGQPREEVRNQSRSFAWQYETEMKNERLLSSTMESDRGKNFHQPVLSIFLASVDGTSSGTCAQTTTTFAASGRRNVNGLVDNLMVPSCSQTYAPQQGQANHFSYEENNWRHQRKGRGRPRRRRREYDEERRELQRENGTIANRKRDRSWSQMNFHHHGRNNNFHDGPRGSALQSKKCPRRHSWNSLCGSSGSSSCSDAESHSYNRRNDDYSSEETTRKDARWSNNRYHKDYRDFSPYRRHRNDRRSRSLRFHYFDEFQNLSEEQRHVRHSRRRTGSPNNRRNQSRRERPHYKPRGFYPKLGDLSLPSSRCSFSYRQSPVSNRRSASYTRSRSLIPRNASRGKRWRRRRERDRPSFDNYHYHYLRSEDKQERDHRRHVAVSNKLHEQSGDNIIIMSEDEGSGHDHHDDDDERRDDEVGHFKGGRGALVGLHYEIVRDLGIGTFGRVVECKDRRSGTLNNASASEPSSSRTVAIKIVRDVKRYYESAQIEGDILAAVNSRGGRGKSLCVQLLDRFDVHNRFYCLAFERLGKSLYEFLKAQDFAPFPLYCVRDFAFQLLDALDFLHQSGLKLVHTDLKPENILLVSDEETYFCGIDGTRQVVPASTKIKIIDFGGATYDNEKKSSVINTRQYRAPEVILGVGWSLPSDLWSSGCIISELYTGDLLFATHDNKEHLALMEQCVGRFPKKMLEHSHLGRQIFDLKSCKHRRSSVLNPSSLMHVERMLSLEELVKPQDHESGLLELLRNLLTIDPSVRMTASKARDLPFCRSTNSQALSEQKAPWRST